jgi:hypothetical protein
MWCGEGDLKPARLLPPAAGTSSAFWVFPSGRKRPNLLKFGWGTVLSGEPSGRLAAGIVVRENLSVMAELSSSGFETVWNDGEFLLSRI